MPEDERPDLNNNPADDKPIPDDACCVTCRRGGDPEEMDDQVWCGFKRRWIEPDDQKDNTCWEWPVGQREDGDV